MSISNEFRAADGVKYRIDYKEDEDVFLFGIQFHQTYNSTTDLKKGEVETFIKLLQQALEDAKEKLFVVRQYDRHDNQWIDITGAVSKKDAEDRWNKETENGTRHAKYSDGLYYKIFPADAKMLYSDGFGGKGEFTDDDF